jgi:hypothetical protein
MGVRDVVMGGDIRDQQKLCVPLESLVWLEKGKIGPEIGLIELRLDYFLHLSVRQVAFIIEHYGPERVILTLSHVPLHLGSLKKKSLF